MSPQVLDPYKQDFEEACAVLWLSPKASAALSRRNLQAVLRDKAGTIKKDLFDQIEEVISSGKVPSYISDELHAVRNIGNFAAHEIKSKVTGQIVEVEPGEAEWNLDVLESLFDFYFVEPAKAAKRKADLNVKLKEAGKPEFLRVLNLASIQRAHEEVRNDCGSGDMDGAVCRWIPTPSQALG